MLFGNLSNQDRITVCVQKGNFTLAHDCVLFEISVKLIPQSRERLHCNRKIFESVPFESVLVKNHCNTGNDLNKVKQVAAKCYSTPRHGALQATK